MKIKKITSKIIAASLILQGFLSSTASLTQNIASAEDLTASQKADVLAYGDVNADGEITSEDATLDLIYFANSLVGEKSSFRDFAKSYFISEKNIPKSPSRGEKDYFGDVNKDEKITSEDATMILICFAMSLVEESPSEAEKKLENMSNEEKVAQLFFVALDGLTGVTGTTWAGTYTKSSYDKIPVGGVCLFADNIKTPTQLKTLNTNLQTICSKESKIPLMISVDEEGGKVKRIASNPAFGVKDVGPMNAIGSTKNVKNAYAAGNTIGSYLSLLGFNMDFAPCADVLTNPKNTVIGSRSFGTDPDLVSSMAENLAKGLSYNNIIPCYKHFPGHGATSQDSHTGMATTDKTLAEMKKSELVPFKDGADNNIDMVMVSHISCPKITWDNTPSTLSKKMVTDILKDDLGYKGLIITDALNMGAVSNYYKTGDACVKALNAGCDMLLLTGKLNDGYTAVLDAVKSGKVSQERLDEAVLKILELKYSKLK